MTTGLKVSRTTVFPLKGQIITLELLSALLLAQLIMSVSESPRYELLGIFRTHKLPQFGSKRYWKAFVQNRVEKI